MNLVTSEDVVGVPVHNWVVSLDNGKVIKESDMLVEGGENPWLRLKDYVEKNNTNIYDMAFKDKDGNMISLRCAQEGYFYIKKFMALLGAGNNAQVLAYGFGYFDGENAHIHWETESGGQSYEVREKDKCGFGLITKR